MAEKYFTQTSEAFSRPVASSSRSRRSLKEIYYSRNKGDYPCAVDEDDLDVNAEVFPVFYRQGSSTAEYDGLDTVTFADETSTTQYFNDEDLFGPLSPDSDYFSFLQGGDHHHHHSGQEEDILSEGELSELEEDLLFDWDSDDTMTNARFVLRHTSIRRDRVQKDHDDVALKLHDTVPLATEDGTPQYFDADDLFEREEGEMLVYGRDVWNSEDY